MYLHGYLVVYDKISLIMFGYLIQKNNNFFQITYIVCTHLFLWYLMHYTDLFSVAVVPALLASHSQQLISAAQLYMNYDNNLCLVS